MGPLPVLSAKLRRSNGFPLGACPKTGILNVSTFVFVCVILMLTCIQPSVQVKAHLIPAFSKATVELARMLVTATVVTFRDRTLLTDKLVLLTLTLRRSISVSNDQY